MREMSDKQDLTYLTEELEDDEPRIITFVNDEAHSYRESEVPRDSLVSLSKVLKGVNVLNFDLLLFLDQGASRDLLTSQAISRLNRKLESNDRTEIRTQLRRLLHERTEASTDELVDQLLPDVSIPSPLKLLGARREAEVRLALLREFGAYSSEELGELRSKAENRHALASRWRGKGRIFSVDFHGRQMFPGFQFDASASPLPVVAEVLAELPREEMSDWEVALWWVAANEWLEGKRPVDLLTENPSALPSAASRLAEPSAL
jgi:hypothetical protein